MMTELILERLHWQDLGGQGRDTDIVSLYRAPALWIRRPDAAGPMQRDALGMHLAAAPQKSRSPVRNMNHWNSARNAFSLCGRAWVAGGACSVGAAFRAQHPPTYACIYILSAMLACLPALASALVIQAPNLQQAPLLQVTFATAAVPVTQHVLASVLLDQPAVGVFPADPQLPTVLLADKIADIKAELYGERPPGTKPLSKARISTLQLQLEKEIERKRVKAEIRSTTPAQQRDAMFDAVTGNGGGGSVQLNPFSDPGAVSSAGSRGSR